MGRYLVGGFTRSETRQRILEIHLRKIPTERIEPDVWNQLDSLSKLNSGVTGAELAAAVNEANRKSFHDGQLLNTSQLEKSIESIKPLAAGIRGLERTRQWMKDFARSASPNKAAEVASSSDVYLAGFDASSQFVSSDPSSNNLQMLAEILRRFESDTQE